MTGFERVLTPDCNCASHGLAESYRHSLACPYGRRRNGEEMAERSEATTRVETCGAWECADPAECEAAGRCVAAAAEIARQARAHTFDLISVSDEEIAGLRHRLELIANPKPHRSNSQPDIEWGKRCLRTLDKLVGLLTLARSASTPTKRSAGLNLPPPSKHTRQVLAGMDGPESAWMEPRAERPTNDSTGDSHEG